MNKTQQLLKSLRRPCVEVLLALQEYREKLRLAANDLNIASAPVEALDQALDTLESLTKLDDAAARAERENDNLFNLLARSDVQGDEWKK